MTYTSSLLASWHVKYKQVELAENLTASKRSELDENLAKIPGVHFFFPAITRTTTNNKNPPRKLLHSLKNNHQASLQRPVFGILL